MSIAYKVIGKMDDEGMSEDNAQKLAKDLAMKD